VCLAYVQGVPKIAAIPRAGVSLAGVLGEAAPHPSAPLENSAGEAGRLRATVTVFGLSVFMNRRGASKRRS
jgi:hypothetical protein